MKCSKCGKIWNVSNTMTNNTCPYCGKITYGYIHLAEIMLKIVNDCGNEILNNASLLNAFIMDYAPDMTKERKLIINAIKEGIMTQLQRELYEQNQDLQIVITKCVHFLMSEMWITETAAQYVINVILYSLGYHLDTENIEHQNKNDTIIKGEFSTSAIIKESDLIHYKSIGYKAFAGQELLEEIYIPQNIEQIYSKAFLNCINLKKVTLTKGTQEIGKGAFDGCTKLEHFIIKDSPYFTVENGILINKKRKIFMRSISSDTISNITNGILTIQTKAYEYSNVKHIYIPKTVEKIEQNAFYFTMDLENINVDCKNSFYKSIEGVLHNKDGSIILRYPQGKNNISYYLNESVKKIGNRAFSAAIKLSAITFTSSVEEIDSNAFEYCINIETIMLPNSIKIIGERAFQYCEKLNSVMLPQGILKIGDCAFLNCISLKAISIPRSVKEIGNMAFAGCKSLSVITIQENVRFIGYDAFLDCTDIKVIIKNNDYVVTYCKTHGIEYHIK